MATGSSRSSPPPGRTYAEASTIDSVHSTRRSSRCEKTLLESEEWLPVRTSVLVLSSASTSFSLPPLSASVNLVMVPRSVLIHALIVVLLSSLMIRDALLFSTALNPRASTSATAMTKGAPIMSSGTPSAFLPIPTEYVPKQEATPGSSSTYSLSPFRTSYLSSHWYAPPRPKPSFRSTAHAPWKSAGSHAGLGSSPPPPSEKPSISDCIGRKRAGERCTLTAGTSTYTLLPGSSAGAPRWKLPESKCTEKLSFSMM